MNKTNIRRADLNLLVVFDAIARTRSVTRAGSALSLSQPAVSHALRRLRELMDDPLFSRGKNGLVLTPRAEQCAGEVQLILEAVGRVFDGVPFDPATTTRAFRIAVSDYALATIMPHVARKMRQTAQGSTIEVSSIDSGVATRLQSGAVDVAFVGERLSEALVVCELFRERFVGLVCERHPLAAKATRGTVTLAEYLAHPHVAVAFGNPGQSPIDATLVGLGKKRRIVMTTPGFAANLGSVRGTDLVISLPSRLAADSVQAGLVTFKLPLAVPEYPYFMCWHRRTDNDPAIAWLRGVVIDAVAPIKRVGPIRRIR